MSRWVGRGAQICGREECPDEQGGESIFVVGRGVQMSREGSPDLW